MPGLAAGYWYWYGYAYCWDWAWGEGIDGMDPCGESTLALDRL